MVAHHRPFQVNGTEITCPHQFVKFLIFKTKATLPGLPSGYPARIAMKLGCCIFVMSRDRLFSVSRGGSGVQIAKHHA
jgi:hypothetical protein